MIVERFEVVAIYKPGDYDIHAYVVKMSQRWHLTLLF
jgi:hypothetical protein